MSLLSSMSCFSSSRRLSVLSSVVVAALIFIIALPSPASAFTGYAVTQQGAPGQVAATYSGTMTRQYPLGPFPNKSTLLAPSDDIYASWWQTPVSFPPLPGVTPAKPFVFPFFGVNYTSITVTSKGFIYLGQLRLL